MKPIIPFALLGALFAVGAATAATTTPVGYITHTINANPGTSSVTYLSPSLIQPTVFAGQSTTSPSGLTTITFSGGVPALTGAHVLEISDGTKEGWWSTVVSSTATTITVSDAFPASLPAATPISVRLHTTLKSFLGANTPGLTAFDGVVANDEVQVLDPVGQVATGYAYVPAAISGAPADGWFNLGSSSPADDVIIEPGAAVVIKRFSSTPLTFVSTGTVKTTSTEVDLYPNFNWVGTFSAAGTTLDGMGFNTQLVTFTGSNTNYDELQFVNPDQSATAHAALDESLIDPQTMVNLGSSEPSGTDPYKEGVGTILKRAPSEAASTIVVPGAAVGQ